MWEAILAGLTLLLSWGFEVVQSKNAEKRSASETRIRALYQAVKDRFGISYDQLEQAANKLDFKLSQLTDSTRGSARLSSASKKLRDYVKNYPELKDKINAAKNTITNAVNNLTSKEAAKSAAIQSRKNVNSKDVLEDVAPEISKINTALNDVNSALGSNNSEVKQNTIDTNLKDVNEIEKAKKTALLEDAIKQGFKKGSKGSSIANAIQGAANKATEEIERKGKNNA